MRALSTFKTFYGTSFKKHRKAEQLKGMENPVSETKYKS